MPNLSKMSSENYRVHPLDTELDEEAALSAQTKPGGFMHIFDDVSSSVRTLWIVVPVVLLIE